MTDKHTPGKLQAIHGSYLTISGTSESIGRCGTHGPHMENARRIAACWNACDGIPTERLLKAANDPTPVFQLLMEATDERNELLRHLQACVSGWEKGVNVFEPMQAAKALIKLFEPDANKPT